MSQVSGAASLQLLSDDYVNKASAAGFQPPAITAAVAASVAKLTAPVNQISQFTLGLCFGPVNDSTLLRPEMIAAYADLKIGGVRTWWNPNKWTDSIDPSIFASLVHLAGQGFDNTIVLDLQGAITPYAPTIVEFISYANRFPGPDITGAKKVELNEVDYSAYNKLAPNQLSGVIGSIGPILNAKGYGLVVSVSSDIGWYDQLNKFHALQYIRWIGHHTYNANSNDKIAADKAQQAQVAGYQKQGLTIGWYESEYGYHAKGNPAAPGMVTAGIQWASKQAMRADYYAAIADNVHSAGYEGLFTQNADGSLAKTAYYAALKSGLA